MPERIWAVEFLGDPEKLTIAGLLVAFLALFITERIVPGGTYRRALEDRAHTTRQRDRLFDLCLRLAGIADKSANTTNQVLSSVEAYGGSMPGPMEGTGNAPE